MRLSIGIVGLPNVGKSTLFNQITKNQVLAANYPFATIDPNVGVVEVPDQRLDKLTEISKSEKRVPAIVEFYDIAGLVKGASSGEGLGNKFLSHIRETQAIVHVLRCFQNEEIIHVANKVDPLSDLEIINAELALKDIETLEKRIDKAEGEAKAAPPAGGKQAQKDFELLDKTREALSQGESIIELAGEPVIKELRLLSTKKKLYLLNGDESDVSEELKAKIKAEGSAFVVANLGKEPVLNELIKKAYEVLGLISFFTTGEEESRAWTIRDGSTAPQAAGAIHTDFENKFIRAEVVAYSDLIEAGSWNGAKQKGKMRVEGKEYIVQDGDVMVIRHG
ncbi:MAG: redox-regulated ATPase YchF [bacterium]|nr:redox-regulated ATPase YchF [bacterium]